ncbi:MarR family winged helix-turn-helix transcriptional regulator [Olivibacter sp. CPCC 100613]|uniref:MarR family winged helix-turn-helix transcriptional regulator n=1 Tax=Olivibacter sp. CPCC 100613 TaxID=3079931 RepID=UPI002FF7F359
MDFYRIPGYLIFGSRLRRLSEYYISELNSVYQLLGIPFDTSWFSFFYILSEAEEISLIDLSNRLQISHSSVSQMINNLRQKKLVKSVRDKQDARKQVVTLTKTGRKMLDDIKPVWRSIESVLSTFETRDENLKDFLDRLSKLEDTLRARPLREHILADMQPK